MRRGVLRVGLSLLLLVCAHPASAGDEIDEALTRPRSQAIASLEALLERAQGAGDAARQARCQELLGRLYVEDGRPYAALVHLDARLRTTGAAADRLAYGEALLATARAHIASEGLGRNVAPFLRDALTTLAPLPLGADGGLEDDLRARAALARMEAHYRLGEHEEAAAAFAAVGAADRAPGLQAALHDMLGRVRFAQQRWEDAAEAFEAAGSDLGAAAAWDAARRPERSVPLYARQIAAQPGNAAVLEQALQGARYTGAHAQLAEALAAIPVPEAAAGVELLLARSDLLEGAGRAAAALPLLRDAAERAPEDERPLLRLGRLILVAGDAEDETAWDEAAAAFTAALERNPESLAAAEGLNWIAQRDFGRLWAAWRDGRVGARCLRVQEALVAAAPDDALAWSNLGNTLRVLGRHEEALAAYARAVEANPFDPAVLSDRGLARSAAGQAAGALADYEQSLALDSGHLAGRQNAARALWLRGEDDRAEAHLGAAVRTARAVGRGVGTYRFLLDRIWRTRQDPRLR